MTPTTKLPLRTNIFSEFSAFKRRSCLGLIVPLSSVVVSAKNFRCLIFHADILCTHDLAFSYLHKYQPNTYVSLQAISIHAFLAK